MKIESTEFTDADFDSFIAEYLDHERQNLIGRLRRVAEEVTSFVPSIEARTSSDEKAWSAPETLAHMVVSAQFFGWLVHEVASKNEIPGDIVEMLKLRDVAGSDASAKPPAELAQQLRDTLEQTVGFIESVPVDDLRNTIKYISREMTAEDLVRIPLCGHLEGHVNQIRESLGSS